MFDATWNADMAELADAPDLGSGGRPCRFKSCYPQDFGKTANAAKGAGSFVESRIPAPFLFF